VARPEKSAIGAGTIPSRLQDTPIEVLDLSSRTYNCLKRSQITTVGQLLQMSEEELLGLRNFGQKSLQELHEKLASHGIIVPDEGRRSYDDDEEEEDLDDTEYEDDWDVRPHGRGSDAAYARSRRSRGFRGDDDD
jgi:hypothetical protein